MQQDMHYHGTYCLARLAGISEARAKVIATSAQYVDDAASNLQLDFQDGAMLTAQATAHHMMDIKNVGSVDQRKVWVPYHFLPGGEGDSFTERLLCRKDSEIAQEMLEVNLYKAQHCDFGDALIGVTAHVYADTFAHYDFSGVSSRLNRAKNLQVLNGGDNELDTSLIEKKKDGFFSKFGDHGGLLANIKGFVGENLSGALGHGAAATYPDKPYLKWSLNWDDPKGRTEERNNPETFIEGAEKLFNYFHDYAKKVRDTSRELDFQTHKSKVIEILATVGEKQLRAEAWSTAVSDKSLGLAESAIPDYSGDEWSKDFSALRSQTNSLDANNEDVVKFYQASAFHRVSVLRDILPRRKLIVG